MVDAEHDLGFVGDPMFTSNEMYFSWQCRACPGFGLTIT